MAKNNSIEVTVHNDQFTPRYSALFGHNYIEDVTMSSVKRIRTLVNNYPAARTYLYFPNQYNDVVFGIYEREA